ncbi:MAG: ATP-binding protein, partial [Rudanella sp.]|nr:ATP-binding protein [Rudanella sp.]
DEATPSFLIKLGRNTSAKPGDTVNELQAWLAKNPRIELAENCLNPILEKFFLELSLAGESKSPISLRTKAGVQIPNNTLSTGTRQLLATAIPIYKFDTKDTVILFDEPERSLFPDVQRELVRYYTGLAPDAQFFFATHSPIIAAAFEPCERFILYFDENGEVKFHNGVAPEGDDPNDILRQDFGMEYLMLQKGLEEYERYRQLAMQIRVETDEEKKNQLIFERLELGNRYNFAGQYAKN